MKSRLFSLLLFAAACFTGMAQTHEKEVSLHLKATLHQLIKVHKDLGYDNLWSCFQETDMRPDGKIWDIYSNISNFDYQSHGEDVSAQEGGNYNREHSVPQSWFKSLSPMKADLFHVYPVDGHLNSLRNNHPYGEVSSITTPSANNFSVYGTPTAACGAPCNVFEPADEYKGDLARTYFYMALCYQDKLSDWTGEVFGPASAPDAYAGYAGYPGMAEWALRMFIRWSKDDPVSQKEIDRNNAIYKLQGNRNPFIDCPGLERYIWSEYVK